MKNTSFLVLMLLCASPLFAQDTVYVDAVKNCLGPNGGEYLVHKVKKGATYEVSIAGGKAIFNTNDNAQLANVGVMYVDKRKMLIKSVEKDKKLTVVTEGTLYFFFVDDPVQNTGGFKVLVAAKK